MTALELAEILEGMRLPSGYNNGALEDAAAELRRLAELERDAARYRWLRYADLDAVASKFWPSGIVPDFEEFDAAIDAAMGEAK